MLKTYYHDPFTKICNEVGFTDKIDMKLSDKYYNINNFLNKTNLESFFIYEMIIK